MSSNEFVPPQVLRFGEKLRALRRYHGMTIQQVTYAIGYTGYGYLSELETSKKLPTLDVIMRIARLFNVSIDQLLKDELELDFGDQPTASTDDTP
jgi:transcriptional regulator with XRE-family HTH domain